MSKLLVRPAGLLLALMCFALPFLAVSCESLVGTVSAEYSGADFVFGGEPEFTGAIPGQGTSAGGEQEDEGAEETTGSDGRVAPQPSAILAFLTIVAGLVVAVVPRTRRHAPVNLGASAVVTLMLVVNQIVLHDTAVNELRDSGEAFVLQAGDMVGSRYGFWVALSLLLAGLGYNVYEVVRERGGLAPARPPAAPPPTPPTP